MYALLRVACCADNTDVDIGTKQAVQCAPRLYASRLQQAKYTVHIMWQWLKRVWKGQDGCIKQASGPRTSSPLEPVDVSNGAAAEGRTNSNTTSTTLGEPHAAHEGCVPAGLVTKQVAAPAGEPRTLFQSTWSASISKGIYFH